MVPVGSSLRNSGLFIMRSPAEAGPPLVSCKVLIAGPEDARGRDCLATAVGSGTPPLSGKRGSARPVTEDGSGKSVLARPLLVAAKGRSALPKSPSFINTPRPAEAGLPRYSGSSSASCSVASPGLGSRPLAAGARSPLPVNSPRPDTIPLPKAFKGCKNPRRSTGLRGDVDPLLIGS